jgi:hypothetical protein
MPTSTEVCYARRTLSGAHVVQANAALRRPEPGNHPAGVVFSFEKVDPLLLEHVAKRLLSLKGTTPEKESERALARVVTNEAFEPTKRTLLPSALTDGARVYFAHAGIERSRLPGAVLKGNGLICRTLDAPGAIVLMERCNYRFTHCWKVQPRGQFANQIHKVSRPLGCSAMQRTPYTLLVMFTPAARHA